MIFENAHCNFSSLGTYKNQTDNNLTIKHPYLSVRSTHSAGAPDWLHRLWDMRVGCAYRRGGHFAPGGYVFDTKGKFIEHYTGYTIFPQNTVFPMPAPGTSRRKHLPSWRQSSSLGKPRLFFIRISSTFAPLSILAYTCAFYSVFWVHRYYITIIFSL